MSETADDILRAMLRAKSVDGRKSVLKGVKWPGGKGSIIPPILATYHEAKQEARSGDQPEYVRALRAFEALSLKARGALKRFDDQGRVLGDNLPEDVDGFPTIKATDLVDAIAAAAAKFTEESNIRGGSSDEPRARERLLHEGPDRLRGRRGLQVIGYFIDGNVNLSNLRLPFSVRLIGCVINGAVTAHHASLGTLDLCGSAVRGVFATALQATGSIRLRRMVSFAPLDFGGSQIAGSLDATDCVVMPMNKPPDRDSYAGHRGVFHLALANIGSEMYAGRARIYGGLCMNGASIGRSLYLEDAAIHAPISVIQRMAKSHSDGNRFIDINEERRNKNYEIMYKWTDKEARPFSFHKDETEFIEGRCIRSAEVPDLLLRLISESARARTCAFRGDGLKVGGNIFATGLRANGRMRIKYAKVEQAFQLYGAKFHSSEIIKHDLDVLEKGSNGGLALDAWAESRKNLPMREVRKLGDYALDIREASFGGDVTLGLDWGMRTWRAHNSDPGHKLANPSRVEGSIGARGVKINGDFDLTGVVAIMESHASLRMRKEQEFGDRFKAEMGEVSVKFLILDHADIGGDLVLEQTRGIPGLAAEQAHIRGDVRFGPPLPTHDEQWPSHKCCSLAPIIHGDAPDEPDDGIDDSQEADEAKLVRAYRKSLEYLSPKLGFRSARIDGDAVVLFNPLFGPDLDFQFAHIGGHLEILPWSRDKRSRPEGEDGKGLHLASADCRLIGADRERVGALYERAPSDEAKTKARECFDDDKSQADKARKARSKARNWTIDLRHATAGVFTDHPLAWPRQNGLRISRFVYHAARRAGPLAPFPIKHDIAFWEGRLVWLAAASPPLAALLFLIMGPAFRSALGSLNLFLVVLWGCVCLALFGLSRGIQTTRKSAEPMAIPWLALQETEEAARDSHKRSGDPIYWRLMPYVQAADVLRSEGRYVEAGLVEKERLKEWRRSLSPRIHLVPSVFLYMVDLVSEYGFNPTRTVLTICAIVLVGAMAFSFGERRCQAAAWISMPPIGAQNEPVKANRWPPPFESLVYAADISVPFLNLREQDHWEMVKANCKTRASDPPAMVMLLAQLDGTPTFRWLRILGQLMGVGLAALIATAIITRARLWLARLDE